MEENKENVAEVATEKPKVDEKVDQLKVKKPKMKKTKGPEDNIYKVGLDKPEKENETKEQTSEDSVDDKGAVKLVEDATATPEQKEVQPETETQEQPVLEEITDEEVKEQVEELETKVTDAIVESEETGKQLPESIEKLISFMEETGGDLNDYVKLNQDYSNVGEEDLLFEYYKQTKPHLSRDEINFLMDDQFSYDEESEDERDIKRKKLALKEQVANAKAYLDGQKSKYYEDIKSGTKLTKEQQEAINFFNKYNEELEENQKASKQNTEFFTQETNKVFNDKFKGFEYNVGDKRYRFNVNNVEDVKSTQSDLNNFTKKFLDKNMRLSDAAGYHKSLYTAMNADAIAKHFYEQGKADAVKESVTKAKNINMEPRQGHNEIQTGGVKARVLGENSSNFKFKIKNNK